MNTSQIEKYFLGETSVKEELEIIQYFTSKNIDTEFIQYQNYFRSLAELKTHSNTIIPKEIYENFTPASKNHTYYIKRWAVALAVAASVALLLLLFPSLYKSSDFVVINGKKFTDKKHIELALTASLDNVKLDVKQIFDEFDDLDDVVMR
jgi:hypothetical protein